MARSASTLAARKRLPPGVKPKQLVRKVIMKYYNVTFTDHTGRSALMSWDRPDDEPSLPPLSSWVFYMVNPDVPRDFDGCAFQRGLEESVEYSLRGGEFRYEFYFLPGATAEECVAHYRGEMAARGTIWRQIRKVKTAMKKKQEEGEGADDSAEGPSSDDEAQNATAGDQLPGLVWPKFHHDYEFINYRGWLFMYPDANVQWDANHEDHDIYLVKFDPVPIEWEEGEVIRFDPMEHPIYLKRMSARGTEGVEIGVADWMDERKNSYWEREANDATCDAKDLG